MTTHVFLSPHLDDAVLSVGGLIGAQADRGLDVVVATVCTADAPSDVELSPLARELHERWHVPVAPYRARRQEDLAACLVLGARSLHLGLLDAVYRRGPRGERYASFEELFGDVPPWDEAFAHEVLAVVRRVVAKLAPAAIYAPLAAGDNVDHQLVMRAALVIHQEGGDVWLYEDQPYSAGLYGARTDEPLASALASCEVKLVPETHAVDFGRKRKAIRRYESQLVELFGTDEARLEGLADYARSIPVEGTHTTHAERVWRVAR